MWTGWGKRILPGALGKTQLRKLKRFQFFPQGFPHDSLRLLNGFSVQLVKKSAIFDTPMSEFSPNLNSSITTTRMHDLLGLE